MMKIHHDLKISMMVSKGKKRRKGRRRKMKEGWMNGKKEERKEKEWKERSQRMMQHLRVILNGIVL